MNINELERKVSQVNELLNKPFNIQVSLPAEYTITDNFTNFLRSGPRRKIVVFNLNCGSYEYTDRALKRAEAVERAANDAIYDAALEVMKKKWGAPLIVNSSSELPGIDAADSVFTIIDDVARTPEYDGGALFEDADRLEFKCWYETDQFIVLQKGNWYHDGNFLAFVVVSICI